MASNTGNTNITSYLGDVINSTKNLVDGLLERAGDVETDVRSSVSANIADGASSGGGSEASPEELAQLRQSLVALTEKVDQLTAQQKK